MVMFVVVLNGSRSARIDDNMLDRILGMVSTGRPMLVCCNQMSRYLDWWNTAARTNQACENLRITIFEAARKRNVPCGKVTVFWTDFTMYSALEAEMQKKNIKSTEHVSAVYLV